jgi:hypothetical protein
MVGHEDDGAKTYVPILSLGRELQPFLHII